jgi:twitching motility protein PilT
MVVLRVIPFEVPSLATLDLPSGVSEIVSADRGLVLVTGATSSGKSSTLAALINHINTTARKHIVTLEQPIEFLHRDLNCSVTQREVGVDTDSIAVGLHAALRQDPDVVVIGDIGDPETAVAALKAAETGRLVIAALPTPDVSTTISHILAMIPTAEREIGRMRLAESLRGIVAQQLLPRADGNGRVAAMEILSATPAVRDILRDPARAAELQKIMKTDGEMQTLKQHLDALVKSGVVARDTARVTTTAS